MHQSQAAIIPPSQTIHIVNTSTASSPKQAPIKIRNLSNSSVVSSPLQPALSPQPAAALLANVQVQRGAPLRALVLANNSSTTVVNTTGSLLTLAQANALKKEHFPDVVFKSLNFEELAVSIWKDRIFLKIDKSLHLG